MKKIVISMVILVCISSFVSAYSLFDEGWKRQALIKVDAGPSVRVPDYLWNEYHKGNKSAVFDYKAPIGSACTYSFYQIIEKKGYCFGCARVEIKHNIKGYIGRSSYGDLRCYS